jgi:hypothetical protein
MHAFSLFPTHSSSLKERKIDIVLCLSQLFFVPWLIVSASQTHKMDSRAGRNYTKAPHAGWCSIITHCLLRLSLTLYRQCRPAAEAAREKERESAHGAVCCIHRSLFLTAAGVVWCHIIIISHLRSSIARATLASASPLISVNSIGWCSLSCKSRPA